VLDQDIRDKAAELVMADQLGGRAHASPRTGK
jgi:hypothetical protein